MNSKMTKWGTMFLLCGALSLFSCKVAEKKPPQKADASLPDKKTSSSEEVKKDYSPDFHPQARVKKDAASIVQSEGKNKPSSDNVRNEGSNKSVRFTFKEVSPNCRSGVFCVLEDGKFVQIPAIMGVLGGSVLLPAGRLIEIYDKPPVDGVPQGNKILTTNIPENMGDNVAAIIIPLKNGEYDLVFIDELRLVPGSFYLHNLTEESLNIQIGKGDVITLEPGDRDFVTLGFVDGKNLHPVKLMRKDDKGKWYVTRQFSLFSRKGLSDITFLMWNESVNKPDVQKITVSRENAPANRPATHTGS